MEKFNDDLGKLQRGNVLACEEVNESFDLIWHDFMTLFNLRFPLKKSQIQQKCPQNSKLYDNRTSCLA